MIEPPNIALIGSPGAGKKTAAAYLKKRFGEDFVAFIPETVNDYLDAELYGLTIVRIVADKDQRAARTNNPEIGDDPFAGLKADHTVFNQGTRDLMYNQLLDVVTQEVAKF